MVHERKKKEVEILKTMIGEFKVIGLIDMFNLPASQLRDLKKSLGETAVIRVSKKRLINRAIKASEKKNLEELTKTNAVQPAFIFSNENPFKLYQIAEKNKAPTHVKAGDTTPKDIIVPKGNTNFAPGPILGELQKVGIKTQISGETIEVTTDSQVAEEGDTISPDLASVLSRLDIKPIEIGLNILKVWENGTVFDKNVLAIDTEEYISNIQTAFRNAFNLSVNTGYLTKETVEFIIIKAHNNALNLAVKTEILNKETINPLVQKAYAQAKCLESKLPEEIK